MSTRFTLRYEVTRPNLFTAFWNAGKFDEDKAFDDVIHIAEEMGISYDYDISVDGLIFTIDFVCDSDEQRSDFHDKVNEVSAKYQREYKQEYDDRNRYHEENGIIENTLFFEETS